MKDSLNSMFRQLTGREKGPLPRGISTYRSSILNALSQNIADELVVTHALLGDEDLRGLVGDFLIVQDADWDFTQTLTDFSVWLTTLPAFAETPFIHALAVFEAKVWKVRTLREDGPDSAIEHTEQYGEVGLWQKLFPAVVATGKIGVNFDETIENLDLGFPSARDESRWRITYAEGKVILKELVDFAGPD